MKKINQNVEKVFKTGLELEKLENEAKAYGRLRYHRNKKSKVFNPLDQHIDFSFSLAQTSWDHNYCSINPCAKA